MNFETIPFFSLRYRLLLPLWAASIAAAIVVATLSFFLGRQWAIHDVQEQFTGVQQTMEQSTFPLTSSVISSLSRLSGTELITVDEHDKPLASTFATNVVRDGLLQRLIQNPPPAEHHEPQSIRVGSHDYLVFVVVRSNPRHSIDGVRRVFVFFDQAKVAAASRRAGLLPMATGLSTIALLTTWMMWMTGRLARRLARLEQGVQLIASGNFETTLRETAADEVGRLGQSVNTMAAKLQQLWLQVNRQQSQKLLHQVAGGMAHQLRNTLTGARLALELHRKSCHQSDQQDLAVALLEMESAEDYVRRLLLVGTGQQQTDQPASVLSCLQTVRTSHAVVAKHLRVELTWDFDDTLVETMVADGATLSSAVSNLVLNGLQAAGHVQVRAELLDNAMCAVRVVDDGPGIDPTIAEHLFEPFVTTKSEGVGLGLALVQRAAEKLSGHVEWKRQGDRTIFDFYCKVTSCQS